MLIIKPKLAFLQMQSKGIFGHTIELRQAPIGKARKGLDPVDMVTTSNKLNIAVIHPKIFIKANIHQTIISTPAIGFDSAKRICFASDNRLQYALRRVGNNLCVNLITPFKQPKNNDVTACTGTTFTTHSAWAKVRLISLQLATQGRSLKTLLSHAFAHTQVDAVHTSNRDTTPCRGFGNRQIQGKMFDNLTKLGFAEFRTIEIPVFANHFKRLAYIDNMFAS